MKRRAASTTSCVSSFVMGRGYATARHPATSARGYATRLAKSARSSWSAGELSLAGRAAPVSALGERETTAKPSALGSESAGLAVIRADTFPTPPPTRNPPAGATAGGVFAGMRRATPRGHGETL